jgi:hypothetical protein
VCPTPVSRCFARLGWGFLTLILHTSASSALKLLAFARILYAVTAFLLAPKSKSSSALLDPASTNDVHRSVHKET